jgi:hypothetical protein
VLQKMKAVNTTQRTQRTVVEKTTTSITTSSSSGGASAATTTTTTTTATGGGGAATRTETAQNTTETKRVAFGSTPSQALSTPTGVSQTHAKLTNTQHAQASVTQRAVISAPSVHPTPDALRSIVAPSTTREAPHMSAASANQAMGFRSQSYHIEPHQLPKQASVS